jgi:hypothetical protein
MMKVLWKPLLLAGLMLAGLTGARAQTPPYTDAWISSLNYNTEYPCGLLGTPTDQIKAAIAQAAYYGLGGTVDLTCYQTDITLTSDIFASVTAEIKLVLPEHTVTVGANVTIPANFTLVYGPKSALARSPGFVLTDNSTPMRASTGLQLLDLGISTAPTLTPGAAGSCAIGPYYYSITSLPSTGGQTQGSAEAHVTLTPGQTSVGLAWPADSFSATYRIYRGASSGSENVYYTSATNSFTDTCAAGTAGSPPTTNTAWVPLKPGSGGLGTVTSVALVGTANQITVTGASPITGSGSWTLSFPSVLILPGSTQIGNQNVTAGGIAIAGSASTPGSITIYGSGATPGSSIISVNGAGSTLNLGSNNATVDASGNVSAVSFTGPLTGNASTASNVPYSGLTGLTLASLVGNSSGSGPGQEITVGNGLLLSGGVLSATGNISAGVGVSFYFEDRNAGTFPCVGIPNNTAPSTNINNTYEGDCLYTFPDTTIPQLSDAIAVNATTVPWEFYQSAALGRTTLDSGTWTSNLWAETSNASGTKHLTTAVFDVIPNSAYGGSCTGAISGAGTSRTFATTSCGSTVFVAADACNTSTCPGTGGANLPTTGFVINPDPATGGVYPITAVGSGTSVTITVPATFNNNASGLAFYKAQNLFQIVGPGLTTSLVFYATASAQLAFTLVGGAVDELGVMEFATGSAAATITYTHNGSSHYSGLSTPLGAPIPWQNITNGTNANTLLVSGSLAPTGAGTITANQLSSSTLGPAGFSISSGDVGTPTWTAGANSWTSTVPVIAPSFATNGPYNSAYNFTDGISGAPAVVASTVQVLAPDSIQAAGYQLKLPGTEPTPGQRLGVASIASHIAVGSWSTPASLNGSFTAGAAYYQAAGGLTEAEADAVGTTPAVCLAISTATCIYSGVYQFGSSQGWTSGNIIYLSDAGAGALLNAAPSTSGHFVQRVGIALANDTILWLPSLDVGGIQ